jgi:hypothetical protein
LFQATAETLSLLDLLLPPLLTAHSPVQEMTSSFAVLATASLFMF